MNEVHVALEAARAAAVLLQGRPTQVDHKGTIDLVTELDLAAERAVREVLTRHMPDIPVLGEEGGGAWEAPTRWVVDPLDGTTNFVHDFPAYAVSIALEVDGEPHTGVIIDVPRGREYAGQQGRGAFCNGARLRVSPRQPLGAALVGTGFPYDRRERADEYLAVFKAVMVRAQGVRRVGAAALDMAMVATGQLDAFWEFGLGWWDVAAGIVLIREAGGQVSDHGGGALDKRRVDIIASNGLLHDSMIEVLASVR